MHTKVQTQNLGGGQCSAAFNPAAALVTDQELCLCQRESWHDGTDADAIVLHVTLLIQVNTVGSLFKRGLDVAGLAVL